MTSKKLTFSEMYICAIAGTLYIKSETNSSSRKRVFSPTCGRKFYTATVFPMSGKIGGNESLTLSPANFFRWEVIGMAMREDSLCYNAVIPVKKNKYVMKQCLTMALYNPLVTLW